ncbi:tRNA glutamyl-Q(34) synthetase GluQRS [Segniliparus rugosus]|uniref:Glutamyl-queuosine tRNA(Asp) synthetase n=1 Tax=Segniliparus rugosus (strain ATCC BAA-974 / DSM 45345 / CCUG 50838 / CIP 108380 / JCM 13579 / CDC 945) TaxID=679197 RepID=E5XM42_SEGRC|nr:tRNA glutamyl-Q(34) synthetase GluQRS [Segniliparus rugosus]EFV14581.2 glutamyl-queuosine tRNA(Asp) synthetase [Segniliparus rugosus ATCC BAA-974]
MRPVGRFAPSPSGDLHVGNLRTAMLAWLCARSAGGGFELRVEDLDERARPGVAERQIADLAAVGVDWDGPVLRQSGRREVYRAVVAELAGRGLVYECWCSRREIAEAPRAPNSPPGSYPGVCRELSEARRRELRSSAPRPPALRLASAVREFAVADLVHGRHVGAVDDFVLLRWDGTPAYNLAVVVDDAAQGVTQVVRGDDLLSSAPRQAYLASLLGLPEVEYAHVPMVLNASRQRLAKRDGAVTLADLAAMGTGTEEAVRLLLRSVGSAADTLGEAAASFDLRRVPAAPMTWP